MYCREKWGRIQEAAQAGLERHEDVLTLKNRMFYSPIFTCHLARHSSSWNLLSQQHYFSHFAHLYVFKCPQLKINREALLPILLPSPPLCVHNLRAARNTQTLVNCSGLGWEVVKREERERSRKEIQYEVRASKHLFSLTQKVNVFMAH